MENRVEELRINNYYQLEKGVLGGVICQIKNGEDLKEAYDLINDGLLLPIPLTEEWFLKFGAEHTKMLNSGIQKSYKLAGIKFDISNSGNVYHSQTRNPIRYVHRLQNLIFELKDIELTINE